MAEQIQLHLEARLPELEDLAKNGIFSEEKIRDIVSRRTRYEYRLKRRGAILEDFLAYINYEKQLESERIDRASQLSIKGRRSVSNYSLVQHIYGLYQRALVKFKGEESLWKEFLEFALLQGGRQIFSKNIAKALQVHPLHAPFWIMAAKFEWEVHGNMSVSRTLFQQAIRTNPEAADIWIAFFELELDFATKVQERRCILGLSEAPTSPAVLQEEEDESVLNGSLAIVIFDHALKSLTSTSPSVAYRFWIAARNNTAFPQVLNHVKASFLNHHFYNAEFTKSFVRQLTGTESKADNLQEALDLLDSIFASKPCHDLLEVCVDFLLEIPQSVDPPHRAKVSAVVGEKIDQIFLLAEEKQLLTLSSYSKWISLFNRIGYSSDTKKAILERIQSLLPDSKDISVSTLGLQIDDCLCLAGLKGIPKAIKNVHPISLREDLLNRFCAKWKTLVQGASNKKSLDMIMDVLCDPSVAFPPNFSEILCVIRELYGRDEARDFCTKLSTKRTVDAAFYQHWIAMEVFNDTVAVDAFQVRKLYNKALILNRCEEKLWIEFIRFERSKQCFSEAAALYNRALKELPGSCNLTNKLK